MAKVTTINEGDSGLQARTAYNEAIAEVEVSTGIEGDGNAGTPVKLADSVPVTDHIYQVGYVDNGNSGATATIDWTAGNLQKITLDQSTTLSFTAPTGATTMVLTIIQDSTGGWSVTLPGNVQTPTGASIIINTDPDAVTKLGMEYDGTTYWVAQSTAAAGTVSSVNGNSPDGGGNVTIDADDIDETTARYWLVEATKVNSNTMTFSSPKDIIYMNNANPLTGDVTLDDTGAVTGAQRIMIHQQASAPAINLGNFTLFSTNGEYVENAAPVINWIIVTYIGNDQIDITYRSGGNQIQASDLKITGEAFLNEVYDNGSQSGTYDIDWTNGNHQKITVSGVLTLTHTPPSGACDLSLEVTWSSSSALTVPTYYTAGGNALTLTDTSGATDLISLRYDGSKYVAGVINDIQST